jgi:hypothetical protein
MGVVGVEVEIEPFVAVVVLYRFSDVKNISEVVPDVVGNPGKFVGPVNDHRGTVGLSDGTKRKHLCLCALRGGIDLAVRCLHTEDDTSWESDEKERPPEISRFVPVGNVEPAKWLNLFASGSGVAVRPNQPRSK